MSGQTRFGHVNVVIIDDNDTTRAMLRAILRSEGIEVLGEARDGASGLALIQKLAPTLACLDVMLPDMSGIAVLAQIKAQSPQVRVVMVTGSTDRDTVQAAIQGGANGYLVKPFNASKILAAFEQAMGRKGAA